MATKTIKSSDKKQKLIISTINTHIPFFNECGLDYKTQKRRKVTFVWWNPATWGGGYEWKDSNDVLQPGSLNLLFFMGNGTQRNPMDFNLTNSTDVGYFKTTAVSANVSNPPQNDVSWITRVTLSFEYEGKTYNI